MRPRRSLTVSTAIVSSGRGGVAVDAGADGWEGNGAQFVFLHKLHAAAIAASQGGFLAIASSAPYGADGVDHPASGKVVAFRYLGVACFTASQCPAFSQQTRPGGPVNCSVHSAPAEQGVVGGVDDGVDVQRGDVSLDDGYAPEGVRR